MHACGRVCIDPLLTQDGDWVCRFTGLVTSSRDVVNGLYGNFKHTPGYVPAEVPEYSVETVLERANDLTLRLGTLGQRNTREMFFAQCVVAVTSVLGNDRFQQEARDSNKTSTLIQQTIRRYIDQCNSQKVLPNFAHARDLVWRERQRLPSLTMVRAKQRTIKTMAAAYAQVVTVLWYVLRKYAGERGRTVTPASGFRAFVVAVLELCETGLIITDLSQEYDITVVKQDPVLSIARMTVEGQQTVLGTTRNLAKLRKNIKFALQNAVDELKVSPEDLRISSYKLGDLDNDVFAT